MPSRDHDDLFNRDGSLNAREVRRLGRAAESRSKIQVLPTLPFLDAEGAGMAIGAPVQASAITSVASAVTLNLVTNYCPGTSTVEYTPITWNTDGTITVGTPYCVASPTGCCGGAPGVPPLCCPGVVFPSTYCLTITAPGSPANGQTFTLNGGSTTYAVPSGTQAITFACVYPSSWGIRVGNPGGIFSQPNGLIPLNDQGGSCGPNGPWVTGAGGPGQRLQIVLPNGTYCNLWVGGGTPADGATPALLSIAPNACAGGTAPSRSSLGTAATVAAGAASLTLSGITLPANSLLIVGIAEIDLTGSGFAGNPTVAWGANSMTNAKALTEALSPKQVRLTQWNYFSAAGGGPSNIVATFTHNPTAALMIAVEVLNLTSNTLDQTASNSGSGTPVNITAPGATGTANLYCQVFCAGDSFVGSNNPNSGFTLSQAVALNVSGVGYQLLDCYQVFSVVTTPGTTFGMTGAGGWVDTLVCNK